MTEKLKIRAPLPKYVTYIYDVSKRKEEKNGLVKKKLQRRNV